MASNLLAMATEHSVLAVKEQKGPKSAKQAQMESTQRAPTGSMYLRSR